MIGNWEGGVYLSAAYEQKQLTDESNEAPKFQPSGVKGLLSSITILMYYIRYIIIPEKNEEYKGHRPR